jgi:hypothetical protein
MMLGFALLCAAIVTAGCAVARWLYRRFDPDAPPLERFVAGALLGVILWLAANWALAITFTLTRRNLLIVAALFAIAALSSLPSPRSRGEGGRRPGDGRHSPAVRPTTIAAALVIAAWCAFVLWRGSVVPPASHDVLTYHLPKALMIARAHGYERFDVPDLRIATFPSNYELLLADVLILAKSDRLTEWIGTGFYLLFLGVVALFARAWWGKGAHVTAAVLAAAGAPLLLLHSGHDKNDVMTAAFAAAALFWSARWCARRGALPAMLAIACGAAAVGTKMTGAAVAIGIAPFGIAALLRRRPRPAAFAGALLFAVVALLLCGGWVFVENARAPLPHVAAGLPTSQYGQWANLWKVPYLAVRVSLGLDGSLPFTGERWPWPAENLFASHYGPAFALAALALPFCLWRYRGDAERTIAAAAAAIGVAVLLPLIQYPRIAQPSILRYTLFALPVLYGWTIAPIVRNLRYAPAIVAALAVLFGIYALDMAWNDALAPLPYARWCAEHPGTREIFWSSAHAESVVDRMAGPHDTVAIHGEYDTWIYPAYGAALSRNVVFALAPRDIPPDAQWVVIDQMPSKQDGPDAEELEFFRALSRDPHFRLVYRNERANQAVFRRVAGAAILPGHVADGPAEVARQGPARGQRRLLSIRHGRTNPAAAGDPEPARTNARGNARQSRAGRSQGL